MLGIAPESPASGARFVGTLFDFRDSLTKKRRLNLMRFSHTINFYNWQKYNLSKYWIIKELRYLKLRFCKSRKNNNCCVE